ncbi:DUF29 domain-containing protein [Chroococcidiopsis sp. SAG 2025]|uniref:DUF29 domain-containing protein n=1 Tax=Chroococcidiopsis sp. SAG 2025 TaxID=171389 RepID=UPI0029373C95|nr:DUF29 domain-containing protein [Chroococcidiopsis sp. SAG 2025]
MTAYDTDYGLWLNEQIERLKTRQWEQIDVENLIEELEQLNKSNKRELYSYLVVVLSHLLKWQYQPQMRSGSWRGSISNSRKRIGRLFKDQPSLKPYVAEILVEAYAEASEWASDETGIPVSFFPPECLYTVEQILAVDFFPDDVETRE